MSAVMAAPQRLVLTPKVCSPLGALSVRPEIARLLDPSPDIDLADIQLELQEIEAHYAKLIGSSVNSQGPRADAPKFEGAKRFGGNVADVADFGRGGFRMQLLDTELYNDDLDEDTIKEAVKPVLLNRDEEVNKRNSLTPPRGLDVERSEAEWGKSPLLLKTDRVETALREVNRERLLKVQEEIRQALALSERKFKEEQHRTAERLALVKKDELAKTERARRNDKQDQRRIAELRDQHLSALQRDHEQRSQVEERAIRKEAAAEESRRREHERVRELQRKAREAAEAEAKKKADAEKERVAAELAKRKAQADASAAAALQRAEAERNTKLEAEQRVQAQVRASQQAAQAPILSVPKPRVSETAAKLEEDRLNKLRELQDVYKHLAMDPAYKKDFRLYERQIIKHIQQVSATQEQVRKKSADLIGLFQDQKPPRQFLMVTLGAKLLSQCESQVQVLPSYAFALAQVTVNVASQVPFLMESVLAQLHQVCIFTVPKYFVFSKTQFGNDEAYYKALGYKEEDGKLESTDLYVARMNAYMTFYAALTQTEVGGFQNPHGLGDAWSWCSRLLNRIPANRLSASALESFLKTAGYRLFQVYPKPFMKLMQAVVSEFVVSLKNHDDADARAVVYRLETYLHTGQFRNAPEGRNMSIRDISSDMRA